MTQGDDQWKEMLRAVLGDQAAEEVIAAMNEQGIDPASLTPGGTMDFSAALTQLRSMLSGGGDGPVNWDLAEQVARQTLTTEGVDQLSNAQVSDSKSHLDLASMWLDDVTDIEAVHGPHQAWSRLDWVAHAQSTFRKLTEPVAANLGRAFTTAMDSQIESMPEEITAMIGGRAGTVMTQMMASVSGMQYGAALAKLAQVSFGSTDTGLPLVEGHTSSLVPANIAEFAGGLDVPLSEVQLYVAVREQAHARLFAHSPWLRAYLLDTVAAWARDITIDMTAVEEQIRSIDFTDQSAMPELDITDVFSPVSSEKQQAVLTQLETILALIEGWVTEVTRAATERHLPASGALAEMFIRRRATGGPAEVAFGNLVGLELRPRKLREATEFWRRLGEDIPARDHYWSHPDLLPDSENLDNIDEFLGTAGALDAEIDDLLADIFAETESGQDPSGPEEPLPPSTESGD